MKRESRSWSEIIADLITKLIQLAISAWVVMLAGSYIHELWAPHFRPPGYIATAVILVSVYSVTNGVAATIRTAVRYGA